MDIICPRCAEPIDMDALHDEVSARAENGKKTTFEEVRRGFYEKGCGATLEASGYSDGLLCPDRRKSAPAQASAALNEVLGYDVDGMAAMLEDIGLT